MNLIEIELTNNEKFWRSEALEGGNLVMWFEQFEGRSWGLQDFYRMSKFCSTKCEVQKMYCTTALGKLNSSPTP